MPSRTLRWILIALILAAVLQENTLSAVLAQGGGQLASDEAPFYCPYTNAAYYQKGLFPRYVITTHSLVLVDDKSGQTVRTLDTFTDNVRLINWSPDCRFLSGAVGQIWRGFGSGDNAHVTWNSWRVAFWDRIDGKRAFLSQQLAGYYLAPESVLWRYDSSRALILSGCDTYSDRCVAERHQYDFLWRSDTNVAVRLAGLPIEPEFKPTRGTYFFSFKRNPGLFGQYYWDTPRSWIWSNDLGSVVAYDINTAALVASFRADISNSYASDPWIESGFVLSEDKSKVVAYSTMERNGPGPAYERRGMTVYDIASGQGIGVNVEGLASPSVAYTGYHHVALSPDNRYLVSGINALRVWDLQNLPTNFADRLPTYRHAGPKSPIWSVHFVAPLVVETESAAGRQKWDIITGKFIP